MTENQVLFPLKKIQSAEVLCSGDGLVLLKNHKAYKNYVLWNPSTRDQYRTLSCPDNDLYYNGKLRKPHACGLCYDSSVNDFKVILIYDLFYTLYSLNKDSWTKKTSFRCPLLPPAEDIVNGGISTEGCVFWSLNNSLIYLFVDRTSMIIYFDMKSDEVKKLPTPDFVGENDCFFLASVKDCLSLYGGTIQGKQLDIWIKERDGKWKWLMNGSNLPSSCKKFVQDRDLLYCTRNGELLFHGWDCFRFFIYNPRQQLHEETHISYSKNKDPAIVSICLDSLYSSSLTVKRKRKPKSV